MSRLKLYFLGSPQLTLYDVPITIGRQKALALLCYLAVKGEPQRRDTLAALLWPEQSQQQARQTLSRHLFALKEALDDSWLVADQATIGLRVTAKRWLDVALFRTHLAENERCWSSTSLKVSWKRGTGWTILTMKSRQLGESCIHNNNNHQGDNHTSWLGEHPE